MWKVKLVHVQNKLQATLFLLCTGKMMIMTLSFVNSSAWLIGLLVDFSPAIVLCKLCSLEVCAV